VCNARCVEQFVDEVRLLRTDSEEDCISEARRLTPEVQMLHRTVAVHVTVSHVAVCHYNWPQP